MSEAPGSGPTRPGRRGTMALRTLAMPADTNPSGDIFGGWIMSHMDLAAGLSATEIARGRVVTAAVSHIQFLLPVHMGDAVSIYTDVVKIGRSSITLAVEVWVMRHRVGDHLKVTEAEFVLVAVDDAGKPRAMTLEA